MNAQTDFANAAMMAGSPEPLGATLTSDGVNFAVYSSSASRVEICLFDPSGQTELARLELPEHTENVWHGLLPAPQGGQGLVYGIRVHGPYDPLHGMRHNPNKLLIDPYARALAGKFTWNAALLGQAPDADEERADSEDSAPYVYKARVIDNAFDWGDDCPPATPWRDSVIYEVHVKGFTRLHPKVPEQERGTYLGLAHPEVISYLKNLGIT